MSNIENKSTKSMKYSIDFDEDIIDKTNPLLEKIKCAICFDLAWDPVQIACNNCVFCRCCISQTINPRCPLDNKPFQPKDIKSLRENLLFWTLVNSTKIHCPMYKRSGCEWIGQYSDVEKHMNSCDFITTKCSLCDKQVIRKSLEDHKNNECNYRFVNCGECGDKDIPFSEMKYHSQSQCASTVVPCRFATYGCSSLILKRNISKHESDYKDRHFELVTKSLDSKHNTVTSFAPVMETLAGSSSISMMNGHYNVSTSGFSSVGVSNIGLKTGRWYYEAVIKSNNIMQIGWRSSDFKIRSFDEGVGDCQESCGYDGNREHIWHNGPITAYGTKWAENDVIGLGISILGNQQEFNVWKNGILISTTLTNMTTSGKCVYPALSLDRNSKCCLVFHKNLLRYLPDNYSPIYNTSQFEKSPVTPLTASVGDMVDIRYGKWYLGEVIAINNCLEVRIISQQETVTSSRTSIYVAPAGSHSC